MVSLNVLWLKQDKALAARSHVLAKEIPVVK
jgi:hypothetical protein